MVNKTEEIKVMVTPATKKKIKEKAEELGLTITGFIEKIAKEPIVFMDKNVKNLVDTMGKIFPNSI